eukprot:8494394-Karenia_brevis.AAC.1
MQTSQAPQAPQTLQTASMILHTHPLKILEYSLAVDINIKKTVGAPWGGFWPPGVRRARSRPAFDEFGVFDVPGRSRWTLLGCISAPQRLQSGLERAWSGTERPGTSDTPNTSN